MADYGEDINAKIRSVRQQIASLDTMVGQVSTRRVVSSCPDR